MSMRNSTSHNYYRSRFQAYVVWVDHNGTVQDMQKQGSIESFSPGTGRNYHIGVVKLNNMDGTIAMNVTVPMSVLGEFKLPQLGDIVWIEESRRGPTGSQPTYIYSTYNSLGNPSDVVGPTPPPQWGSMAGDRGEILSYRDHVRQFVPTVNSNFIKKYVKSITGYRQRQFYRGNLVKGRYAVRGDSVFDIDPSVSKEYLVEDGTYVGYGGNLETDQGEYPNPLNVPKEREEDENYKYIKVLFRPIEAEVSGNQYDLESKTSYVKRETESHTLKNKNYLSYQPVLDKSYLEKAEFERELPAAEEYQVALRGNNKLLIQDQYGDGEQILITLKNQYDAGITILHNSDNGQVRIRDHMGQGVMLEANKDAPRVMAWTKNRQVVEMGAVEGAGEFTYIRNGSVFGDSQTSFGTKTGVTKNDVPNQELLMVSTPDILGELSSRLSSGMASWATGGPGLFFRNSAESPSATEQKLALFQDNSDLVSKFESKMDNGNMHTWESIVSPSSTTETTTHITADALGQITATRETSSDYAKNTTVLTNDSGDVITTKEETGVGFTSNVVIAGNAINDIESESGNLTLRRYLEGDIESEIQMSEGAIDIRRMMSVGINIGADGQTGGITIGNSLDTVNIIGSAVAIKDSD